MEHKPAAKTDVVAWGRKTAPVALTEAASEHGVSKLLEAEKESHSSNPHIQARGALGHPIYQA